MIIFFYADWRALSLVCQIFFIVFSVVLSTSFIYTGRKIIKHVNLSALHISRMGSRSVRTRKRDSTKAPKPYTPNVSKLVKITYFTAGLGLVSCTLQLYSIFFVYDMYSSQRRKDPEPWPWLIFQTLYRIVELLAGITMAYVSPRQVREQNRVLMPWLSILGKKLRYNPAVFYNESGTSETSGNQKMNLELQQQ
jgi:hypothetical protein